MPRKIQPSLANITLLPQPPNDNPAVALYSLEQKLKEVAAGLEELRFAMVSQAKDPNCLFAEIAKEKKLLTPKDISGLLNLDTRTIYNLIRSKAMPALHVGGKLRFDPIAISQWLRERNQER
jgi:excisionase family DNA binding protein